MHLLVLLLHPLHSRLPGVRVPRLFCALPTDPHPSPANSSSSPAVFSKRELFDQLYIELPSSGQRTTTASLLRPEEKERELTQSADEDFTLEVVDTFRFRVRRSDLDRARSSNSSLAAMHGLGSDESSLVLDASMAALIGDADEQRGDSEVIRIDIDLAELQTMVSAADDRDLSRTLYTEDFEEQEQHKAEKYDYDASQMQSAAEQMRSPAKSRKPQQSPQRLSRWVLPSILLSKSALALDFPSTLVLGALLCSVVFGFDTLAGTMVRMMERLWRLAMRTLKRKSARLHSLVNRPYPVVLLVVLAVLLTQRLLLWRRSSEWRDLERYLQRQQK